MSARWRPAHVASVAAMSLLGLYVCYVKLGVATVGVDEPTYIEEGWRYVHGDYAVGLEAFGQPLLAKQLIGVTADLFGREPGSVRLWGATCGFLTGLLLFDLARRMAGHWAGIAASIMWFALPQSPGTAVIRLDRYAVLEPTAILLGVAAIWCVARWLHGRGNWWWAGGAALVGLAASAKLPAAAFIAGPAFALTSVDLSWRARARQFGTMLAIAIVAFLAPFGVAGREAMSNLRAVFDQLAHAGEGHAQLIAGQVRFHHPWWTNFWWQHVYLGWPAVVALWVLAVFGIARLPAPNRQLVLGTLAGPLAFLTVSPIKLPHYHVIIIGPLVLAAGIGLTSLCAAVRADRRWRVRAASGVVVLMVCGSLVVPALHQQYDLATLGRSDYQRVSEVLARAGLRGGEVAVWGWPQALAPYLPSGYTADGPFAADPVAVVVDPVVAERVGGTDPAAVHIAGLIAGRSPSRVDRLEVYVLGT